ncbi:hypothetical protein K491DRAFT_679687 [Lophiostoma macrostomum CBS 122681]|uniref:Uncharacterized protein n=1 Tax=Lophiostoma macrostomum CBS 122681 TaxID=1314788 RepID=A0A6A6T5F0_9PLEO|nr:hypothetical protein K491DRAFT_679687 [Lophiostoma macrostomum CBS 122681]
MCHTDSWRMAVSIAAGTKGLVQLGLSLSDLALLIDQGKKFGNFVRITHNDGDLFDFIGETPEALLKRRGLVSTMEMEKRWPKITFVHRGEVVKGKIVESKQAQNEMKAADDRKRPKGKKNGSEDVQAFTWVMVAIVSALDECLPSSDTRELLIQVFVAVLNGDSETENALRVHINVNIESWRSFGCARQLAYSIRTEMRKSLTKLVEGASTIRAISQLNHAEKVDLMQLLVWLLSGEEEGFSALSAVTFAIAEAWKAVRLDLCTDGKPAHEGQACIFYRPDIISASDELAKSLPRSLRGLGSRTLQISWPRNEPHTMIDVLGVGRPLENAMAKAWSYGFEASKDVDLLGQAELPFEDTKEVCYCLDEPPPHALVIKKYSPHIGMLAYHAFPVDLETIYEPLERILEGEPVNSLTWLSRHVEVNHLLRAESAEVKHEKEFIPVFLKYQALVFGFYYGLLGKLICLDLADATAYFRGIWGKQSTTFLAMCTQFSNCLRRESKVSRAHVLYLLSAMYNGRRKVFNANLSMPRLVGVLGPISVLVLPLIRTTDVPEEIWKIAIVDLTIVDLVSDNRDGELLTSDGGGIQFLVADEAPDVVVTSIQQGGSTSKWTVNPHMNILFSGEESSGVVMAARCDGRLVGWFNPLAADILFLSSAYTKSAYEEEGEINAFEVKDEDLRAGKAYQPDLSRDGHKFGVVLSNGSAALRYATAGFYGEIGHEVAIAKTRNELYGAFGRLEAQGQGMIIS